MKKLLLLTLLSLMMVSMVSGADSVSNRKSVYVIPIKENIMPSTWRMVKNCMHDAQSRNSDLILIEMNTYGGVVDVADSIRTAILNSKIPVVVFINNQAVSAGALISIAADSIYMRKGSTFGAATVVNGADGQPMPDKYQSFMRAMMRATAESHGKVIDKIEGRDTTWRWRRDPHIAEAMVDPSIVVEGVIDSTKVLSLTTDEAVRLGFCEGTANSVEEVVKECIAEPSEIYEYKSTTLDKIMGFLTNPALQSMLILFMVGGIFFELKTPGVGFPLIVAILAAILYFSPLWLEGLLQVWEIALFMVGVILLILEIFVIPGFGVAGIVGILAMITGLAFGMIDNDIFKYIPDNQVDVSSVISPILRVVFSVAIGLVVSFFAIGKMLTSNSSLRRTVVLTSELDNEDGFVAGVHDSDFINRECVVVGALRPGGKVEIDNRYYDAISITGKMIDKGAAVRVVRIENGTLYCQEV